jgi:hypothetical protein
MRPQICSVALQVMPSNPIPRASDNLPAGDSYRWLPRRIDRSTGRMCAVTTVWSSQLHFSGREPWYSRCRQDRAYCTLWPVLRPPLLSVRSCASAASGIAQMRKTGQNASTPAPCGPVHATTQCRRVRVRCGVGAVPREQAGHPGRDRGDRSWGLMRCCDTWGASGTDRTLGSGVHVPASGSWPVTLSEVPTDGAGGANKPKSHSRHRSARAANAQFSCLWRWS